MLEALVHLTGKLNISIDNGCSIEMYNFVQTCVEYGINLSRISKSPELLFIDDFPRPKKDSFRRKFIALSNKLHRERMKDFKQGYCSISLDEGKTLKTPFLDFVLHKVDSSSGEYAAITKVMNGGTAEEYVDLINKGSNELLKYNINPSSIVVDGNAAQLKAFKYDWQCQFGIIPCALLQQKMKQKN